MGLLGQGWNDPQSQAVMQLAGGLLAGNMGQGVAAYGDTMAGAQDKEMRRKLIQSQIDENAAQVEQKKLAAQKAQQLQSMLGRMFGGGDTSGQMSPGAFQPSADGSGPTMPESMRQAPRQGGIAGLSIDDVAQLKAMGGPDFLEAFKWANDPLKLEQGSTYKNRTTGAERFIPKVDAGIALNAQGFYGALPGYAQSVADIEGAKAGATERAKAGYNITTINRSDGTTEQMPVSQAVGRFNSQPAITPPRSANEQALRGQVVGGMGADPKAIQREIAQATSDLQKPLDPSSRKELENYISDLNRQAVNLPAGGRQPATQSPEFGVTQSPDSKSRDAATTVQLEAQAKDVAAQRTSIMNGGFSSGASIAKYQQLGKLLEGVDGGSLTATGTNMASAMNSLGFKIDKNLPNKEAAAALGNEMALQLRSPANGAGMPGAMSDADRTFLVSLIPNASQSAAGRKMLIDSAIAIESRKRDVASFARNYEKKYGKLDNGFFSQMQSWSDANPLFGGK